MKTAVSLPDRLFQDAERHARRSRKSRSQLYAQAISEYLARHAPDEVTEDMNTVIDQVGDSGTDRFPWRAGERVLADVEW